MKDEDIPSNLLKAHPLPETRPSIPSDREQYILSRYMEEMHIYIKQAKVDMLFRNTFIQLRSRNFIPPAEMYEHVLPAVLVYSDFEAIDILIKEMDKLGYEKGEGAYNTLISMAILQDDPIALEKYWNEMLEKKFDINSHMHEMRIFYYTRHSSDLGRIKKLVEEARSKKKIESPTIGNIVLDLCRVNKLFSYADEIYHQMKEDGVLTTSPKDVVVADHEGKTYKFNGKLDSIISTYLLMAEVNCVKGDEKAAYHFLELAGNAQKHHQQSRQISHRRYRPPLRVYKALVHMYIAKDDFKKARSIIQEMTDAGIRPDIGLYKDLLVNLAERGHPREFMEFSQEYELWGFEYEPYMYGKILSMWFKWKDYRRAKNAYEHMINTGQTPDLEAKEVMIQVFDAAGDVYDVQQYYDELIRTGKNLSRKIHEVMLRNLLKRDEPHKAYIVATRMRQEGCPATADDLSSIALKFAELGFGSEVTSLIEKDMMGREAAYTLTPLMVAAAVAGVARQTRDTRSVRALWQRMKSMVKLDYLSAQRIISSFALLKDSESVIEVYKRVKKEYTFTENDDASLFESVLSCPPGADGIDEFVKVLDDMEGFKIPITSTVYIMLFSQCESSGNVIAAYNVMKRFASSNYGNAYNLGVCRHFFNVIARHDFGIYRSQARAWLSRIVPAATNFGPWMPTQREVGVSLDEIDQYVISPIVAIQISTYVNSIDPSKFVVTPPDNKYTELFEGSDADIEDILIHQLGYKPEDVQRVMSEDPKLASLQQKLVEFSEKTGKPIPNSLQSLLPQNNK
eukprot:TRINITY_DN10342_c0_g1_i1.p1 TRINITY_DN10342_c0_g1~~TRINITY_DN10342_c0_g1_i1.p1  ORF type:complete len:911 (-),score=272.68 TRINITY_DN10342_c0_g1_i1:11-2392(-)